MSESLKSKYETEAPKFVVYTKHVTDGGQDYLQFLTSGNSECECHAKAARALVPEWLDKYIIVPTASADCVTRRWYGLED